MIASLEYAVKKISSADGTRLLLILHRPRGRYRFIEYSRLGERGRRYWAPTHWSGTYETAEAAEHDARGTLS